MTTLLMRRETRIRALAAVRGALASDARRATSARAGVGDRATTTSAAVGHAMRNFQRLLTSASASSSSAVSASSQTVDRIDSFKLVKNLTASGLPEAQAHAVVATCLDAMTRAGFVVRSDLERELMQARAEVQRSRWKRIHNCEKLRRRRGIKRRRSWRRMISLERI